MYYMMNLRKLNLNEICIFYLFIFLNILLNNNYMILKIKIIISCNFIII